MVFKILAFAFFATFFGPVHPQCEPCTCLAPQGLELSESEWNPNEYVQRFMGFDRNTQQSCYCVCGQTVNTECTSTSDCHKPLICVGRAKKDDVTGFCKTRCGNDPHFNECGIYERCMEKIDGSYLCKRMISDCKQEAYIPVCATDGTVTKSFANRCYMALLNYSLRDESKTEFTKLSDSACAGEAVIIPAY